jgi:predicted negative regulator of RcsB-dependent stress response
MLLLISTCVGCVELRTAGAAEASRKFLEGLRQRGLYGLAIDYLEQMRASPAAPADFKETIDYEKGILLLATLDTATDRPKQLAEAEKCLATFLQQHPGHASTMVAQARLGRVLMEQGDAAARSAIDPRNPAGKQTEGLPVARSLYEEAGRVLAAAENQFDTRQKQLSKIVAQGSVQELDQRDAARRELLEIRLAQAALVYETAQTYAVGSRQRQDRLTTAAAQYHRLYERYQDLLAGCYARLGEARCVKELGDVKQALLALEELFQQPDDSEAFRQMKNKALLLVLETCLLPSVKDWKQAVTRGQQWLNTARRTEASSTEGLAIQYLTARAIWETAKAFLADDPARAVTLGAARRLLVSASQQPSGYQQAAQVLLLDPLLAAGENNDRNRPGKSGKPSRQSK